MGSVGNPTAVSWGPAGINRIHQINLINRMVSFEGPTSRAWGSAEMNRGYLNQNTVKRITTHQNAANRDYIQETQ